MANIDINGLPYMLVGDITVGTATTSVSFTGLTISKDDDYMLVSSSAVHTSELNVRIYVNNNVTDTNYYSQYLISDGSSVSANRLNVPRIHDIRISSNGFSIAKLKLTNSGYFVYQSANLFSLDSIVSERTWFGTSTFTSTSITSLTLTAQAGSGIGIGSRFQLYKCVAEKVADITVATATTSVSIIGLNIDKTSEYMLVSDCYNPSSTTTETYSLYADSYTTEANYYRQGIFADSSSISAVRSNNAWMCAADALVRVLSITNIKITNNGYFTTQSNFVRRVGSTTIALQNYISSSVFTLTSIATLTITSALANGIGIGSRFQLYKMK